MDVPLKEHLLSLNAEVLRGWLKRLGVPLKGVTRKAQFAKVAEQQLTLHLPAVLARLPPAERNLLAESAHQGRLISAREFTAKYGGDCPLPKVYYSWKEEVSFLTPFIHYPGRWELDGATLVAPLIEPLRTRLPKPGGVRVATVDSLPTELPVPKAGTKERSIRKVHVFEGERIAPTELGRILRLVQSGKLKLTAKNRRPTDATTRLVGQALVVPDFDLEMPKEHRRDPWDTKYYEAAGAVRAHAWPVLAQQCDWARTKGGVLALTNAGREILREFTPEKFREGVNRCLANGDFDELNRVNHIRGQGGKARRWMSNPALRKPAIVRSFHSLPVGEWVQYDQVRRLAEASPAAWDVLKRDAGVLYFCELQYGCIYETDGINRQFLRALLMESLATLGLLDIAYVYPHRLWPDLGGGWGTDELPFCGRYDGLLYVRLNALGAFAMGFVEHYEPCAEERPGLFRILPNHDLVLTEGAVNPVDRALLELLAVPTSDLVWRLDAERMLGHVEAGGAFAELREYLETHALGEVPETIRTFLTETAGRIGACRSREDAVLLAWTDAAQAQLIATSSGARRLCFHAGENRLVVPRKNLAAFSRALKKLGYVLPPPTP